MRVRFVRDELGWLDVDMRSQAQLCVFAQSRFIRKTNHIRLLGLVLGRAITFLINRGILAI
jgi:hypothetical protein